MKFRRISWVSVITGQKGHGCWIPADESQYLEAAVRQANKQCPKLLHFIEIRDKPELYKEQEQEK